MQTLIEKIRHFALKVTIDQRADLQEHYPSIFKSQPHYNDAKVVPGRKYVKVDVGTSGKYMVDSIGDIWGVKGYGVIHRGKYYGNLETIDRYYWGSYAPIKKN